MMSKELLTPSLAAITLDGHTDAIDWVKPVPASTGTIEAFEVGCAHNVPNEAALHPKGDLMGLRVLRDGLPSRPWAFL